MSKPIAVGLLAIALLTGCNDGKPKGDLPPLFPLKGKVVRNGTPVTGGMIRFNVEPENVNLVSNSVVSADGTFDIQTLHAQSQKKASGAPAGTYKVTYYPPFGDQTAGSNPSPVEVGERFTITEGSNEVTVELGTKK